MYQPALVKMEQQYNSWFGANPDAIRGKLVDWVNYCGYDASRVTCTFTKDIDQNWLNDGNNKLNGCQQQKNNARKSWTDMQTFANAYLSSAAKLFQMASLVVTILQQSNSCDPAKFDEGTITVNCK